MSVLIKGIKVHRGSCWECPCLDGEYGDCNVLEKHVNNFSDEECPLIELPDHGDLIDRDELMKHEGYVPFPLGNLPVIFMSYVKGAPAVIPAERNEDPSHPFADSVMMEEGSEDE